MRFKKYIEIYKDAVKEDAVPAGSPLIESNIFRVGSEAYFDYFRTIRSEYKTGNLKESINSHFDIELLEGDLGEFAQYEGSPVPLDCPLVEEEDKKPIGKPQRGGPKKFYVYVRKPDGNIKKVTFGDTTGLKAKIDNPEARKSYVARHKCDMQKDRTTPAYWSCRLPYYAKQLGLSGGGSFFW